MILTNARLVAPNGVREAAEIEISGGKITDVREARSSSGAVDLEGNYLGPGFIDLHVHGAVGRDTMEASGDAIRAICDYHASGGTTSLLLTTATAPMPEITRALDAIRASRNSLPQIAGAHLEGPFISAERPGAQRVEFIREAADDSTHELLHFTNVIKRITVAPEIPGAIQLINKSAA